MMLDGALAQHITAAVGGRSNVVSVDTCFTRLRIVVGKITSVDFKELRALPDISAVFIQGDEVQMALGFRSLAILAAMRTMLNGS